MSKRGLPTRVAMRHDDHFIEHLTYRDGTPIGRMLALSSIQPDPRQPRDAVGDLSELVASIREKGVLEPILVRPAKVRPAKVRPAKVRPAKVRPAKVRRDPDLGPARVPPAG